jgi:hypothetical protein
MLHASFRFAAMMAGSGRREKPENHAPAAPGAGSGKAL